MRRAGDPCDDALSVGGLRAARDGAASRRSPAAAAPTALPARAGVSLKAEHYRDARAATAEGVWFEVHPENYMTAGGPRLAALEAVRADHAVSFHGVGMSLGGVDPLDATHLARWRALADRFAPAAVSEHVAWSRRDGAYFADLLPAPATRAALDALCANIDRMQTALGRAILIENPALYVALPGELDEPEFLAEACRRTGCGLLVDVNNIYVTAWNIGRDPHAYLGALPGERVGEIHLAGHAVREDPGEDLPPLLIDAHAAPVAEAVWALYREAVGVYGPKPTLIERDAALPPFGELLAERAHAERLMRAAAPSRCGDTPGRAVRAAVAA